MWYHLNKEIMEITQIYKTIPKNISKKRLIDELITFFSDTPKINSIIGTILLNDIQVKDGLDKIKLIELIGYLHQKNKEEEKISNTDKRKHFGIYYTPYSIARRLARELLENVDSKSLLDKTFFEPCAGIGIFIFAYLDEIIENKNITSQKNIQKIIDNIYYADIDSDAITLLKIILPLYLRQKYGFKITLKERNSYVGNILFDNKNNKISKINPLNVFNLKRKFNFVLTNPPYKLLKANSNKYKKNDAYNHYNEIKQILHFIRENNIYKYNEGTLNYYKIFIEEILENYTLDNARIGLLVPITLLNDKQSFLLRKRMLDSYNLAKIYTIPENNIFFQDISQSFCFFTIDKSEKTKQIKIINGVNSLIDFDNDGYTLDINTVKNTSDSYSITVTDQIGVKILKKITDNPRLGELGVLNLRGELDLTLHKDYISDNETELPLLRGIDIDGFMLKGYSAFVKQNFLKTLNSKISHVNSTRIVGQQISNMHSKKRLKFALIENAYILGNSCNYLLLEQNLFGDDNLSLKYLLGILNSRLIDWRFRITNSNNHVSNYEIAELPIAITNNSKIKNEIEAVVNKLLTTKDINLEDKLNDIVFDLYNITGSEKKYINNIYAL
jgi:Alw26I/Eco31I/Esp3I family type II restriction m6 adenine DNA methyltransferase